jgi:hypothetical protein
MISRVGFGIILFLLTTAGDLLACAVCFGDPDSHLTLGALAGVAFLLGVLLAVLGGIFAVIIFWMRRARLVEVQAILHEDSGKTS